MSIWQMNIYGKDKVEVAIERFKTFEPKEGYYLAFSGGKDSSVIKALADMSGVKYDAHYTVTSVDPPELVQFIKREHPDVIFDVPRYPEDYRIEKLAGKQITMWNLIPHRNMPPTRIARYCCKQLKEAQGYGRFQVTGVRWAESVRRSKIRAGLELGDSRTGMRDKEDPDNPSQELIHICPTKAMRILNPIIDWDNDEVWEFIREYNIPYCELYDRGYKRLGCVGCPMSTKNAEELERYPKFKQAYLRAFDRMLKINKERGVTCSWETAQEVYDWWVSE